MNRSEELDDMNNLIEVNSESVERDVEDESMHATTATPSTSSPTSPSSSTSPSSPSSPSSSSPTSPPSSSSPTSPSPTSNTDTNDDDILLELADEPETHQPHNTTNSAYFKTIKSKLIRKRKNRFGRMKKWNATLSDFIKRHQKYK